LGPGLDGWIDETIPLHSPWEDIDMADVATSVTWWHAPRDANAPLTAATRLVEQLPNARLVRFGEEKATWPPIGVRASSSTSSSPRVSHSDEGDIFSMIESPSKKV
jgi:hypothetical protein